MDGNDPPLRGAGRVSRRWLVSAGLVASGLVAGGILAGSHIAGAQGATSTATQAAAATQAASGAGHGPDEMLLTGTTASKVRAAALEAVPGGRSSESRPTPTGHRTRRTSRSRMAAWSL